MRAEVLFGPMSRRGEKVLRAMLAGSERAGVQAVRSERYSRDPSRWLIVYGLGEPVRYEAFRAHRAAGGRAVNIDLGYWSRGRSEDGGQAGREDYLVRVSIDTPHPQDRLYDVPHGDGRYRKVNGPQLFGASDPGGPVVIIGMGEKGARWAGYAAGEFEAKALRMARARWPHKQVIYRPKVKRQFPYPVVAGFDRVAADGGIGDVLSGAAVAICQHSNAAIDAVRFGVPILAEDGAVTALVGAGIEREPMVVPIRDRKRFMHALAWWQWSPAEAAAGDVWRFIADMGRR